ncbi:hypothetical protein Tco_0742457 [Tanacetum coccineum]
MSKNHAPLWWLPWGDDGVDRGGSSGCDDDDDDVKMVVGAGCGGDRGGGGSAKELKEMRDGRRDNHTSQIYMKDDTPMCNPMEANYVQRYHGGYHDQNSKLSYSYQDRKPNHHYPKFQPRNRMSHPLQYFKIPETSTKEMMRKLIVGIKRLLDDLGVTADKVCVTTASIKLALFINFNEKYAK